MTIWKAALSAVQTGPDLLSQEDVLCNNTYVTKK